MFKSNSRLNLPALKSFLWNQGVECSVFYGEDAFYLPVNDRLDKGDMDYFCEAICFFAQDNTEHEPPT